MKKFSDFIVNQRYLILTVMLILTVLSAFLVPKVRINEDLTEYLPSDSPMKEGIDIMKEEFPNAQMGGSLRVMFEGLSDEEAGSVKERLANLPDVTAVLFESGSEAYQKDGYTLFEVMCTFPYNSPEEQALESAIRSEFAGTSFVMEHTMATMTQIPAWVYLIVVAVLIVILFVMCASYVEPFLFLFTIGIAILINMGTNAMFRSVSVTTFTLSSVLQLALSMDYSIILMNRYRQGKERLKAPKEAMKEAFAAAFPSIIGSGMTTVLGLLMLIFMRFRIGIDLGRVMAKGVAISMICVLTVLPALILMFDKAIEKTKKKELHIRTKGTAKFSFKARRALAVVFALLFVGTAVFQNIAVITFAQPKENKIGKVFPTSNQVAVIYPNSSEDEINELIPQISAMDSVNTVISFGKPMTTHELSEMMSQMGGTEVDPKLLDFIYYHYSAGEKDPEPMSIEELLHFLRQDLESGGPVGDTLPEDLKAQLLKAEQILNREALTRPRTPGELAELLRELQAQTPDAAGGSTKVLSADQLNLLYSYAYAANPDYNPPAMTAYEFLSFLKTAVAENPAFSGLLAPAVKENLDTALFFATKEEITGQRTAAEIAAVLGADVNLVNPLFSIRFPGEEITAKTMSLTEFVDFTLNFIRANPSIAGFVPPELNSLLALAKPLMDVTLAEKQMTAAEAAALLGLKETDAKLLYTYRVALTQPYALRMSASEFLGFVADHVLKEEALKPMIPVQEAAKIIALRAVADSIVQKVHFSADRMTKMLKGLTGKELPMDLVYFYKGFSDFDSAFMKLPLETVILHVSDKLIADERFANLIDEPTKQMVAKAKATVEEMKPNLVGPNHSILMIDTSLAEESPETTEFVKSLQAAVGEVSGTVYTVGNSVMNVEMEENFKRDLILITALTGIAIFIVVAFTFRSVLIPLILVLIVQCGVFITVTFSGLVGHSIYYLSLLVMQCILMGATVDYGIVFTNYYLDNRMNSGIKDSLIKSFEQSIHTVLTSSLIIIFITGIIGICPADPAITEICQALAIGTASAVLLIVFILPGLLACFDGCFKRVKIIKKFDKLNGIKKD